MRAEFKDRLFECKGAAIIEYAIILGALLVVFLLFGTMLRQNSDNRRDRSMQTVESSVPCDGTGLTGDQCL